MQPGILRLESLRGRLIAAMAVAFLLGIAATAIFVWHEMHELERELAEGALRHQAGYLETAATQAGPLLERLPAPWQQAYRLPGTGFHFVRYDPAGRLVEQSPNLSVPLKRPPDSRRHSIRQEDVDGEDLTVLTIGLPDGGVLQVARTDVDAGLIDAFVDEELEFLSYALLPSIAICLVFIWLVSGWSLRPVRAASIAADRLSPADLAARLATDGLPSEIRPLVAAVNGALDRLAGAYLRERQLTADAAHELRTPVAVLDLSIRRAQATAAPDWPVIQEQLRHLQRLIQQMLSLSARDALEGRAPGVTPARLDLARLAREVAAGLVPMVERQGRSLEVIAPAPVHVHAVSHDLVELLTNLIENALAHGRGTITVVAYAAGDRAVLAVQDRGLGIPQSARTAVFGRFVKLDPSSPGAGLGLAIVQRIVSSLGGTIAFADEHGFTVTIKLPPDRDDAGGLPLASTI